MSRPPMLAVALVESLVADRDLRDAALGDLAEDFERLAAEQSPSAARAWYWSQVGRSTLPLSRLAMRGGVAPWLRLVAAVVLGYAVLAALVVVTSLWMMTRIGGAATWVMPVASLATGALCAVVAGWIAASIGGRSPLLAAMALGVACVVISAVMLRHGGDGSPLWYQVALMLIVFPSVVCGALLPHPSVRRRAHRSNSAGDSL